MLSFWNGAPITVVEATAVGDASRVATLRAMAQFDHDHAGAADPITGAPSTGSTLPMPPPTDASVGSTAAPTWRSIVALRRWIHSRPDRPGDLTERWATLFGTGWLLVAICLVAVWVSSRTTGLSTWWLGPESQPRSVIVNLAPYLAPVALALGAYWRTRWLPWLGLLGALAVGATALGDAGRVKGYALVEAAAALSGLLTSLASFAGMYRRSSAGPAAVEPSR